MTRERANFYYFAVIHLLAISLLMAGCATQSKSVGLGAAIASGTGAVLGGIADPGKDGEFRTRNVIIGATLGGMAGMVAGSVLHDHIEDEKKEAYQKGRASSPPPPAGAMPTLKNARVESHWVEGKASGNRYIEGHFEYVIIEPARWEN